jgi:hypothetical protein
MGNPNKAKIIEALAETLATVRDRKLAKTASHIPFGERRRLYRISAGELSQADICYVARKIHPELIDKRRGNELKQTVQDICLQAGLLQYIEGRICATPPCSWNPNEPGGLWQVERSEHVVADPWICLDCGTEFEPTQNTQCPSCKGGNTQAREETT